MLPTPLDSFIGRGDELAAAERLVAECRLVTLTGAPGIGKSRLALELVRRIRAGSGVAATWIELAPLADADLLPAQAAAALGLREESGRSALAVLRDALQQGDALLVFDSCEHLVAACARLAADLLAACPRVRMLCTSREPLATPGERVYPVPSLSLAETSLPGGEAAGASEAVRLFVDRARAVLPSFALDERNATAVAGICGRLDGLPLAIELAAARVRVLAPEQIAARLHDAFGVLGGGGRAAVSRHRTLRAAIEWSHALLSDRERLMLRRLAVFPGTFSIEAVEAICTDEVISAADALDLLSALVERSWVVVEPREGEARYRLLEVVRQYAAERRPGVEDDAAIRARHAAYFLALVEQLEPRFVGFGGTAELRAMLAEDTANLRAAAGWFESGPGGDDRAIRLVSALSWQCFAEGRFSELRQRATTGLRLAGPAPTLARAKGLTALALAAFGQSDRAAIGEPLDESIAILRGLDAPAALGFALIGRSVSAALAGDAADALARLDEPLALARANGLASLAALALYWRAGIAASMGDMAAGRAAIDEAMAVARAAGDVAALAYTATRSGILATLAGDRAAAEHRFAEALAARHTARNRWATIELLIGMAGVSVDRGDAPLGARLLGAADAACLAMGVSLRGDLEPFYRHVSRAVAAALGEPAFTEARRLGRSLPPDEALELAATPPAVEAATRAAMPGQPGPPPLLEVRSLGPLEIAVGGVEVPERAWRAARPRELLLYLLCHPDGATRDQLGLVFWPEAPPAQLKNGFHVALHHLRKALGRSGLIVFERERYRVNWALGVEFDAARFEADVRSALRDTGAGALARLEAALTRVRGAFLEDAGAGDWHLEHRDRLRQLEVTARLALGEHLERAERHLAAVETYHRVLSADALHEEACRRLMRCYARLGQRGEAARQFERLVTLLRTELDASPEPETIAAFQRLRAGQPL